MKHCFTVAACAALLFVAPGAALAQSEAYRGPIIDMHLHAYGGNYLPGLPNPARGEPSPASLEEHVSRTTAMMRRHNIVLGALSGVSINHVDLWHEHGTDRILSALVLGDPADGPSESEMRALIASGRLRVLGEVIAQYEGLSPSDPVYDPYWAMAEEYGIPVGIHTGASFPGTPFTCCPKFRLKLGDPLLLEDMLVKYPDLKVYFMHAGGQYQSEALEMMTMYPNLHADISVINWLPGLDGWLESFLLGAQQRGILDRVLFGTDQMYWPDAIEMAINRVNGYNFLSMEEKKGIFYDNAARFLGLTDEEIAVHHAPVAERGSDD
jgi:uncharacterized protein